MKKVIITLVALILGVTANAAAVGWTIAGAANYSGGNYYVFVAKESATLDSLISSTFTSDGVSKEAIGNLSSETTYFGGGTVAANGSATKAATVSGATIEYSGSGTDTYYAVAVIVDASEENASYTSTASISMTNNSTSKTFGFANQSANLASHIAGVKDIPEPTSGLLILLGAAGLALKRKFN